jgi:hypothetical protein
MFKVPEYIRIVMKYASRTLSEYSVAHMYTIAKSVPFPVLKALVLSEDAEEISVLKAEYNLNCDSAADRIDICDEEEVK